MLGKSKYALNLHHVKILESLDEQEILTSYQRCLGYFPPWSGEWQSLDQQAEGRVLHLIVDKIKDFDYMSFKTFKNIIFL